MIEEVFFSAKIPLSFWVITPTAGCGITRPSHPPPLITALISLATQNIILAKVLPALVVVLHRHFWSYGMM